MEESVTYQEIVEEGAVKGELREARKSIRLFATPTLGAPSPEVEAALDTIRELDRLERMMVCIQRVKSWEELLRVP